MLFPVFCQHLYGRPMIHPHDTLQHREKLRCEARPTLAQNQVVTILNAKAGDFLEEIELIEQLLKIEELDLPRPLLRFQHAFKRFGGAAMTATRVEEDDCEFAVHKPSPGVKKTI